MKTIVGLASAALLLGCGPLWATKPAGPRPASRPAPKRLGLIVFSSNRSGVWRIWTVKDDGSAMRQLTKGSGDHHDVDPSFSPDGKAVLFTSTRGGKGCVWQMRVDGSHAKRICDGDQAEWSPDGRRIVLRRGGAIFTRELAGGKEKRIAPDGWTACSGPAWSPDGERIAFARIRGGRNAIFLVGAAGGEPKKVHDKQGACEPHWSPDGRRIVYETSTHVFAVGPDGGGNRMITWYGGLQRYPRFGPDGKCIVFCQGATPRGPWELYVVAATGGAPRKLTTGGSDMYPHWR